ncbi:Do family serine endopeptidase [Rhodocytophaga aerolata]|uniref:Do family serine endopeptidase n=1 Tax=Rhodocytophaga aerolata TaxID=455078 RepID=A0ABT8RIP9_9BACT|nr:Do family serine endopeptidase [Rhodocytophaga aerolata]MDO1451043.1 Do family serine endopeptidase [Rhodocytophaga aerolata]
MKLIAWKEMGTTIMAAVLGGCITLGAYKALEEDNKVIIEKVPENYSRVASSYTKSGDINPAAHPDFSMAAEKVTPAVVHIRSSMKGRETPVQNIPSPFRDFFGDDFFGERFRGFNDPAQASGSGVIISQDGYILTNDHVIDKADEIEVTLHDKRSYKAKVIGTDPSTDLALIQIKEKDLPTLPLANSDEVKVGQWVLAVGNPFNLESTVTAGIISAKGRSINILQRNKTPIESFIQTDAAVNPGNSGGALVNLNGELIGINTAIATPTGTYAGYSFAVPTSIASKVVEDFIKYGKVQRAYLGIVIRDVNGKLASEKDLSVNTGVYVDSLMADGAGKAGGIKIGDVITKVDDRNVSSVAELQELIGRHRPGDEVTVTINRKGDEKKLKIPLKNLEGKTEIVKDTRSEVIKSLGAEFTDITEQEKEKANLEAGVKVSKLYPGTLRSSTNMKEGFIITKVNRKPVNSARQLAQMLESEEGGILIEGVYPGDPTVYYYAFGL